MVWIFIYFVGCVVANWLIFKTHKNYMKNHPEETCTSYQWGYWVVAVFFSWISVFAMLFGQIASFNQIEWDEDLPVVSEKELDEYMAEPEKRKVSDEETRKEAIKKLHEMELKRVQEEAVRNSRDF